MLLAIDSFHRRVPGCGALDYRQAERAHPNGTKQTLARLNALLATGGVSER